MPTPYMFRDAQGAYVVKDSNGVPVGRFGTKEDAAVLLRKYTDAEKREW